MNEAKEERERFRLPAGNAPPAVEANSHGFKIYRDPSERAEHLLEELLPDPDRVLEKGDIFKPGSRTHAGVVELAGGKYFLKRYNCRGWRYRLQNALRTSRAVRTWSVTREFVVRGLPVPRPLVCLEERRFRMLGRSYILMDYIEAGEWLHHVWGRLDDGGKCDLLVRLGKLFGRMHGLGCLHGDLKWTNVLVRPDGDIFLVDTDGSRLLPTPDPVLNQQDLERFLRNLDQFEGQKHFRDTLLTEWGKWMEKSISRSRPV